MTAHDVYDLRFNADLVVSSACRSGGGRVTGDGTAAFARAFMYATGPIVLAARPAFWAGFVLIGEPEWNLTPHSGRLQAAQAAETAA